MNRKPWLFSLSTYHKVEIMNKFNYLWRYKRADSITFEFVLTCLNPDGLCLYILAVIPYRIQVLLALNSSSSPTRAQQARGVTEASSQARGKHYTITLTCSTAMVTYLMNKSHYQGSDNSDTAPLLSWQTSASLSIFPSLLLLSFYFSLFSPSPFLPTVLFLTSLARAGCPTGLTLFITRLWHFWIKLHTRTDWTLLVRAGKHRSFPFGFQ